MAKLGGRHSRLLPAGRRSSSFILVLAMLLMLSLVLLMLLTLGVLSLPVSSDDGANVDSSSAVDLHAVRRSADRSEGLGERGEQWTEVLAWEPRAFVYHNFLSKAECEYLIGLAKPHMQKSTVVDSKTGKSKDSRSRLVRKRASVEDVFCKRSASLAAAFGHNLLEERFGGKQSVTAREA